MKKAILANKVGMTQIFNDEGVLFGYCLRLVRCSTQVRPRNDDSSCRVVLIEKDCTSGKVSKAGFQKL
jgi:hypothetical protein